MKNSIIRIVFVLALITAVGVIVSQIFWVTKAYELEDREFDYKVTSSLKNVALKIWEIKKTQSTLYNVVDQVSPGYFIVQVNHQIGSELLEHFLKEQFELQDLITDFEYGQYDCATDTIVNLQHVSMNNSAQNGPGSSLQFPIQSRENYYFAVYFPNRKEYVGEQLQVWIYSSLFLLAVIIIMTLTVYIIMKQKRLSEVQKDFVNNMTHEFKTPLATIQLSAEVLKRPDIIERPQRLLNYATIIDKEASLLALQVERVLQMAHAEKGEIILKKERVIIQETIKEVAENFTNLLEKNEVKLELDLLPRPIYCEIDTLHIKNAIGNLVENAIKYGGSGTKIVIKLIGTDKKIKIQVIDNGPGIAEENQKMLFNKFYRVPKGNRHDVKGFGLGLNYVQIIAKEHGGDVSCFSKEGKGTTFTIILPTKHEK